MAVIVERARNVFHPIHAALVAGTTALFLGALLSDITYFRSYAIQWNNFSSWLLAGGLVIAALALLAAIVRLLRRRRRARSSLYALLLLAAWVLGFIDALVHARDAFATMPTGLVLSVIVVVLAGAALVLALVGERTGGVA